jgi:hypothetical protein
LPFSTAWTRAALAIVSVTISAMPSAACSTGMPTSPATPSRTAASARSGARAILPPAKRAGSIQRSSRSASVTVGRSPPPP